MTDEKRARLIATVAESLNIRIDEDDPGFVIVELNKLILDQSIRQILQAISEAEARLCNLSSIGTTEQSGFARCVAKSITVALIANLKERCFNCHSARNPLPLVTGWKDHAWTFVCAAIATAFIFLSAIATFLWLDIFKLQT